MYAPTPMVPRIYVYVQIYILILLLLLWDCGVHKDIQYNLIAICPPWMRDYKQGSGFAKDNIRRWTQLDNDQQTQQRFVTLETLYSTSCPRGRNLKLTNIHFIITKLKQQHQQRQRDCNKNILTVKFDRHWLTSREKVLQ